MTRIKITEEIIETAYIMSRLADLRGQLTPGSIDVEQLAARIGTTPDALAEVLINLGCEVVE